MKKEGIALAEMEMAPFGRRIYRMLELGNCSYRNNDGSFLLSDIEL